MIEQLRLLLGELPLSRKIGIGAGAAVSALILVAFVAWAGRPNMQPAFTGLTSANAAAISAALRTAKIPFEVADAGSTILVPATAISDARVAAGAAGLGSDAATGFELFDKSNFGMSEFDQQVTYQRALEGKLTTTIQGMDGVASATVSIVAARTGVYAGQDTPATASVMLGMKNGQAPSTALVKGVVSVVAGAVAGLSAENVTVVDDAGRLLAGPAVDAASDIATMQAAVERQLDAKVQALVDLALGPGHSTVAVSATLDMDKVEQTITRVAPINDQNWTPTSVQTIQETYAGSGAAGAAGIPGALSNVPGVPTYPVATAGPAASATPTASATPAASVNPGASAAPTASAAPAGGYTKSQQTVNYNNSQTVERVIKAPGSVERLSVAVLVDQTVAGNLDLAGLKTSIEAAIGATADRGDVVSVTAVPFAAQTVVEPGSDIVGTVTGLAGTVLAGIAALVLLFLVWRNVRFLQRRADELQLAVSMPEQGLLQSYNDQGAPAPLAAIADLDRSPQAKVQERLRMVAAEKPDAIVGLMNDWLREDGRR